MRKMTPLLCLALLATLSGCGEGIARGRVKSALVEAGMKPAPAECMAERMVDRLSFAQLRKLEALKGAGNSAFGVMLAFNNIDDPELKKVVLTSAALCLTGIDQPRRS